MFWKKSIYLDHAAATPIDRRVLRAMKPYFNRHSANPGSLHTEAVLAHKAVEDARSLVAAVLGARPQEIIFTAGGTESNNIAIIGTIRAFKKNNPKVVPHVIVSAIEHKAVFTTVRALAAQNEIELTEVPVDAEGVIDMAIFKQSLLPSTVLVSVMYANNEIGTIQPIREIAKIIRHYKKHTTQTQYPLLHSDAIQAFQYCDSNVLRLGVDLMSVSAAKIYGPKGIAVTYIKTGVPIEPIIFGGGQEHGLRSGTENVASIIGCAHAMKIADAMRSVESDRLYLLQQYFLDCIQNNFPNSIINGSKKDRLSNNINATFPGISGEHLVIELDAQGIAVSAQSACTTDDDSSYVLQAIDSSRNSEEGGIRFSMGRNTTRRDIDRLIKRLQGIINRIQKTNHDLGL